MTLPPGTRPHRLGFTISPPGQPRICPECERHEHGSCWAHLAAIGIPGDPDCGCGCHMPVEDPCLTRAALEDMAAAGTLVDYVLGWNAWMTGTGPVHLKLKCRMCTAREVHVAGETARLF